MTPEQCLVYLTDSLRNSGLVGEVKTEDGSSYLSLQRLEGPQVGTIPLYTGMISGEDSAVFTALDGALKEALKAISKESIYSPR